MGCGWLRGVCFSNTTRYDDALDNNNACIRRCQGLVLPDADELKDQTEGFKGKQGKDLLTEAVAELAEDFPAFTAVSELLHECREPGQGRGKRSVDPVLLSVSLSACGDDSNLACVRTDDDDGDGYVRGPTGSD